MIKREAKKQERSLNAETIQAVGAKAAEVDRRHRLSALRRKLDRFAESLPALDDSAPLIPRDRSR